MLNDDVFCIFCCYGVIDGIYVGLQQPQINTEMTIKLLVHVRLFVQVAVVTWRPCFGDALQHCISTALGAGQVPGLEEILEKSRSIGQHFRGSNVAEKQLERTQEELGLPRKKLKLDCAERWNSVVKHAKCYLFIFVVIFLHCSTHVCLGCRILSKQVGK